MKPRVLNKHRDAVPADAVNVMRPSKFGNPFVIGKHGTRSEVIGKYAQKVGADPEFMAQIRRELRGKSLVCCCAPLPCHADILLKIANGDQP